MVDEYKKIVAKDNETACEMKAIHGDLTTPFLCGKEVDIGRDPDGAFGGFDVVAMCVSDPLLSTTLMKDKPNEIRSLAWISSPTKPSPKPSFTSNS